MALYELFQQSFYSLLFTFRALLTGIEPVIVALTVSNFLSVKAILK